MLYVVRGGNQWRAMPHDLPPWQTAYYYFRRWRNDGTGSRSTAQFAHRRARGWDGSRVRARRFWIASRSRRVTGGPRGDDAHKQVMGRKRHLLMDTQGFALKVVVSAADVHDWDGARLVAQALQVYGLELPQLRKVWVDAGYSGVLVEELRDRMGWDLDIVKRSDTQPKGHSPCSRTGGLSSACLLGGVGCVV